MNTKTARSLTFLFTALVLILSPMLFTSCNSKTVSSDILPTETPLFTEPQETPENTETAASAETPAPTETPAPYETMIASETSYATETPFATETAADTKTPTPTETPDPFEGFTVPTIYINTSDGKDITSKEVYVDGTLSDTTGLADIKCRIRGRGNTTWRDFGKIKPSYRLKIESKESLGGIGGPAGKDYVLVANYSDLTMLRNYIALTLGKRLENISYTSEIKFVNVVLNGKDRGLYLLCTKIKIAESRINIESDETGVTADTGYLLELDKRAAQEDAPYFTIPGTKYNFSIKSDTTSKLQIDYITNAINTFYERCGIGDKELVEEVADIDSIVDMFILEEFVKDRDVGFASFYIIKEAGGKIKFSCPWDFDLSLGNDNDNPSPEGLITEVKNSLDTNPNPFFVSLWKQQWFKDLVYKRFMEVKGTILSVIEDYMKTAELLRESNDRNNAIYNMYGRKIFKEPRNFYKELLTYDDHVLFLKNWMTERLLWLEDCFKQNSMNG